MDISVSVAAIGIVAAWITGFILGFYAAYLRRELRPPAPPLARVSPAPLTLFPVSQPSPPVPPVVPAAAESAEQQALREERKENDWLLAQLARNLRAANDALRQQIYSVGNVIPHVPAGSHPDQPGLPMEIMGHRIMSSGRKCLWVKLRCGFESSLGEYPQEVNTHIRACPTCQAELVGLLSAKRGASAQVT